MFTSKKTFKRKGGNICFGSNQRENRQTAKRLYGFAMAARFNSYQSSGSTIIIKKMRVIPEPRNFVGTYHGKTQYQCYCDFINDVLNSIRRGKPDYCYYIYQIAELLKYEHDRLQAVWLEEERCFKLSLNK